MPARDPLGWTLSGSDDGLTWRKVERVHITHPSHRRSHMTYYTAVDPAGLTENGIAIRDMVWMDRAL